MLKQLFIITTLLLSSFFTQAQLYVTTGETITVSTSGDLNLQESLNNNGTITNLTLGGAGTNTITGTGSIGTLIVNTTGTFTASSGMQTITSLLKPTAGTLAAGGFVTLQSNNSGTAYGTSGAATITGLNVQHYLSSNQRGWRLVGSPFTTGITLASLATASNIDITYGGNNGYSGTSAPSSEYYVPSTNSWTTYTSSTNTLAANSSIALFVRGTAGQGIGTDLSYAAESGTPSYVTLQAQGTLNVGDATVTVTANKPNIIANPFGAPISLNAVLNANSGYSGTIAYYDPTLSTTGVTTKAGGYRTAIPSSADVIIPPMGAFVITSTSGTSFTVPASAINTSATPTTGVLGMENNTISITVNGKDNSVMYDAFTLRFDGGATGATGDRYDFMKMANTNLDVYSISTDNQQLAYDNRYAGTAEQIIPLGIRSGVQQNFTMSVNNNTGINALLRDKLLHTVTPLMNGITTYDFNISTDSSTQGNNRFEIVLNAKMNTNITSDNSSKISVYPNPVTDYIIVQLPTGTSTYTISITDMSGRKVQDVNGASGSIVKIPVKQYSNGYYIVSINDGTNIITKEVFKTR